MVKTRFIHLILLVFIGSSAWSHAEITASVDRTRISENDILSLTIRATDGPVEDQIDLASLERDFSILNTQRSNSISIINGQRTANYDLKLVIAPLRSGQLTIPAFIANGQASQPITIEVAAGSVSANQELKDVFLKNEVSTPEAYVQEQIIYTLRLHHSVGLENASISPLEVENAVIEKLGDQRKYETVLEGIRYSVIEVRYAIFPQSSGRLEIPPQLFSGRTTSQFLGFRAYDSRYVRARSESHVIEVLPKPVSYPQDQPWLPTWELQVQDSWALREPEFRAGEPVTRTISMVGRGLTAAQLPEITLSAPDSIKLYPDQLQSDDVVTDDGIVGQNSIATAFVPSKEGVEQIPGFTVTWWNTQRNRLEQTTIPPKTVQVLPARAGVIAAPPPPQSVPLPLDANAEGLDTSLPVTGSGYWPVATFAMALAWLSTLLLWWLSRRSRTPAPANSARDLTLKQAFRNLQKACRQENPAAARTAVIEWYGQLRPEIGHTADRLSLDAIAERENHPELTAELSSLNQQLYGSHHEDTWSGKALLGIAAAITRQERNQKQQNDAGQDTLAPLYPM